MKQRYTIKQILTTDQAWWNFSQKHKNRLRLSIMRAIVNLLSCKNKVRGGKQYKCSNLACTHTKQVFFTCKAKSCSSCGKKATEVWLQKQKNILPDTTWQHITFTMPDVLWPFFWWNRPLQNKISKLAAECIQSIARAKKIIPGVFTALHTFGRDLKRNVHIHLSVTLGGLSLDHSKWVKIFFNKDMLMRQWRYKLIQLLRAEYNTGALIIPTSIQKLLNHTYTFKHFLDEHYNRYWHVHCARPTDNYKKNIAYLSRYIKRPAIAESRLKHYDGHSIVFQYLNHKTKMFRKKTMSVETFIGKFIQHIPDTGFRMIRYYGFLSNRLRGNLLPTVRQILQQDADSDNLPPSYAQLMLKNFNINPLKCILCGHQMLMSAIQFGITNSAKLLKHHRQLALLQNI